ncbi:Uncharacterized protein TCAP_02199 [Tolypocladium capitatum]|uniref:Uncharacterized protein n=1 Tax=Tolypocladium capitatum TaxID=45235 RepID=A0A2K3QJZ1_9HYPO|nr:Uncharacterized protein TCAP_02199 [Tolypocladium capitatum]
MTRRARTPQHSATTPPAMAAGRKADVETSRQTREPSTLYKLVVTPVAFISFLLALALVDLRYSLVRLRSHAQAPSRLPAWLYALLFRQQPYRESLRGRHRGPSSSSSPLYPSSSSSSQQGSTQWHYHNNQRKLIEMEAAEAFEIRDTVLVVLALAAAGGIGAALYAASWLHHHWYA